VKVEDTKSGSGEFGTEAQGASATAASGQSVVAEATALELKELRAREAAWTAERQALEQALAAMRASTSWRLTRPVRGFSHVLRAARARLRRWVSGPRGGAAGRRPAAGEAFDVIFVIGCREGESKRYRVHNVAAALAERGLKVQVIGDAQCHDIVANKWRARAVVFFRTPYRSELKLPEVLGFLRDQGARIVFDVDDLVFQPGLVDQIHGVSRLSAQDKELYLDGVLRYRRLLKLCDLVTVTTVPLARAVEALGLRAQVVPNSLNREQIAASKAILAAKSGDKPRATIGYFSGSRTHERDFAQAAPALLDLMAARDDFDLLVVGYLDLGPEWARFQHRVRRRDFMPALEMLAVLGDCDINIAPLEAGDPFCEAKSELKFFEAALVGTPSVVSPTQPLRQAVEPGVTGFVASTADEWREALGRLLDDPGLRRDIGARARARVLDVFGVEAVAEAAQAALLGELPPAPQAPQPGSKPRASTSLRIDWVVPPLLIGGGGHRNIIRAAHYLQQFGHDVTMHFIGADQDEELEYLVARHFYAFEGEVRRYDGQFRQSDVILATHWTTVNAALEGRRHTGEVMYFVQDFEPWFYPMGSDYVLAENTYRQGLYCISSGPWCEQRLKANYGVEADHFRFPVDNGIYRPVERSGPSGDVVFFAKPEMPRRCFEIGSAALAHLHRLRPDLHIVLYGSRELRHRTFEFPATVLEVVPTIQDLAALYANADLGMVFSTTNPSLVPYEMMASGCPVVDLDLPGADANYDNRRDIAFLADPSPTVMAEQLAGLLDRPAELADRRAKGLAFVAGFPTELEMARRVEELILRRVRRRSSAEAAAS
jgi:glycosyltransferase involved in cell wall biosynthesis